MRLRADSAGERDRLCALLKCDVEAVSFHNPGMTALETPSQASLAGMVNAYGAPLRASYGYCSDLNGYWRFEPLPVGAEVQSPRAFAGAHPPGMVDPGAYGAT